MANLQSIMNPGGKNGTGMTIPFTEGNRHGYSIMQDVTDMARMGWL